MTVTSNDLGRLLIEMRERSNASDSRPSYEDFCREADIDMEVITDIDDAATMMMMEAIPVGLYDVLWLANMILKASEVAVNTFMIGWHAHKQFRGENE